MNITIRLLILLTILASTAGASPQRSDLHYVWHGPQGAQHAFSPRYTATPCEDLFDAGRTEGWDGRSGWCSRDRAAVMAGAAERRRHSTVEILD